MNTISSYIVDLLGDDIVSHGLLVQCIELDQSCGGEPPLTWKEVLEELLAGEVEIGIARNTLASYVEFIAWRGSVSERISRAVQSVNNAAAFDKEFAYWLCLRKNVDRYEEEQQQDSSQST
jgi:hypothetical protein